MKLNRHYEEMNGAGWEDRNIIRGREKGVREGERESFSNLNDEGKSNSLSHFSNALIEESELS